MLVIGSGMIGLATSYELLNKGLVNLIFFYISNKRLKKPTLGCCFMKPFKFAVLVAFRRRSVQGSQYKL